MLAGRAVVPRAQRMAETAMVKLAAGVRGIMLSAEPEEGHSRTGLAQKTCGERGRGGCMCNRDA